MKTELETKITKNQSIDVKVYQENNRIYDTAKLFVEVID